MAKKMLIPIFPLNGAILFPEKNLPLNIFEELYIDFNLINKIEPVTLIKFIAMSCPFSSADKQMLLETFNLNDLAHKLITLFEYYSSTNKNERSVNEQRI